MLAGSEVRVPPESDEFRGAPVRRDAAVGEIDFGAVVGATVGFGVGHAAVRAGGVEHLFLRLSAFAPALDHLHPLQRRAERVLEGPDEEAGSGRAI